MDQGTAENVKPEVEVEFVRDPKRVTKANEVDGFIFGKVRSGEVVGVSQGRAEFTVDKPIKTENLVNCVCVITRTQKEDGSNRYGLIHAWAGSFDLNHSDQREDFLKKEIPAGSEAIVVVGKRGYWRSVVDDMKYWGVTTTKVIEVDIDDWFGVLFLPDSDEICVRMGNDVKDQAEVLVFDGFKKN